MAEGSSHGGYDFKLKDKCLYECPICRKIIRQFTELPCSHATCKSCLEHWEQKRFEMLKQIGEGDQVRHNCITCNKVYTLKDKHFSGAIDRIIQNDLEVLCKVRKDGCQWFGAIADYQHHSDNECQFRVFSCRFSGCNIKFQRRNHIKHKQSCNEREKKCDYCKIVVKHYNELIHHQNDCSRFPFQCPNQDCQQVLPRNEIDEHRENECLQQEVFCTYSDIGCDVKIKRCHLEKHENEFNATHTKLLFNEFRKTKEQLLTTTKIAQKTQRELKDTKFKLETKTKELEIAKQYIVELETRFEQQHNEIVPLIHKSTEIISQQLIKVQTQSPEKIFKSTLNTLEEPTQLKIQPPIQTKEKKYSFFEFNKLILQTYAEKLRLVFNEIEQGQLFHINDNECFFKLRIQRNHRQFLFQHVDDVTRYRNKDTEFTNDVITLQDYDRSWYFYCHLYVEIEKYDDVNCRSYVINVKECGKNRLLKYGDWNGNEDIRWELYKNKNNEVIFYFNKK